MDTIKVDKRGVLLVAHRGLSGLEPENSIPAFVAAGNRSYFGIETDIHVTSLHMKTWPCCESCCRISRCSF